MKLPAIKRPWILPCFLLLSICANSQNIFQSNGNVGIETINPGFPVSELQKFIKQNHHLPEVSSAVEIETQGLDLGDKQAMLLKKRGN